MPAVPANTPDGIVTTAGELVPLPEPTKDTEPKPLAPPCDTEMPSVPAKGMAPAGAAASTTAIASRRNPREAASMLDSPIRILVRIRMPPLVARNLATDRAGVN
jgi:hypothetical protein